MARRVLWIAPDRMIGESRVAEFQEAGIPVTMEFATGFGEAHPLGPVELFIEEGLLNDPYVSAKLIELMSEEPLTEQDDATIAQMPLQEDTARVSSWTSQHSFVLLALFFIPLVLWLLLQFGRGLFGIYR